MKKLKFQVWKRDLVNPVCVKRIQEDSAGGKEKARKLAVLVKKYLNSRRVRFAVVRHDAAIKFFIPSSSLEE